jgi:hypothetical protein
MPIDYDQLWIPGAVRIRASAPDPYAGLTGHAYIKARGLGVGHVQRLDAFDKAAVVQRLDTEKRAAAAKEVAGNLIPKLARIAAASKRRRFFIVPATKREKAR